MQSFFTPDFYHAALLGFIQGLTEFFPISSSGHLVLCQRAFGLQEPEVLFNILLHLGTLGAVVVYFWKELLILLDQTLKGLKALTQKITWPECLQTYPGFEEFVYLCVAMVPTVAMGLLLNDFFESMFGSEKGVLFALLLTGIILWSTKWIKRGTANQPLNYRIAFLIGLAQGCAIMPGLSRSGVTIVAALWCGLSAQKAIKFSFFLSVLSILAASAYELLHAVAISHFHWWSVLIGVIVSFLTGLASIRGLVSIIQKYKLHWFAVYCVCMSILGFFILV